MLVSSEGFAVGAVQGPNGTITLALQLGTAKPFPCTACPLPRGQWVNVTVTLEHAAARAVIHVGGNRTDFQLPSPAPPVPVAFAGQWGLAVGRQLPIPTYLTNLRHVENDNSSRFDGAVAALRLWGHGFADVTNASAVAAADVSCGQLAGSGGPVACFDFRGSLADASGGADLSPRVGDRFRSWCDGVDDDGQVLQYDGGAVTNFGESWGFCPAPGSQPPLPAAGRNYDPVAMSAMARTGALADVAEAYPGCGRVLLTVRGNQAVGRGGGMYRDSCDSGSTRRGLCFVDGNSPVLAPAQQAIFDGNLAGVAGGGVYVECDTEGAACVSRLNATLALPMAGGPPPRILFDGNRANGWGDDLATAPARIAFAPGGPSTEGREYVPGIEAINFSLVLYDGRGALVRGADTVLRVRICGSASLGGCEDDAGSLVVVPFLPFNPTTGRCAAAGGAPLVCAGGATAVDVQFSVTGSALPPLVVRVGCRSCPPASARRNDPSGRSWQCAPCGADQYVVDSNNPAYTCHDCPAGATCDGHSLRGAVAGSVWVVDPAAGQYHLTLCPAGYRLVDTDIATGLFSFASQRCVPCAADEYIVDTSSPNATCQPCPVGASCNGSMLQGLVNGSLWVLDRGAGMYVLQACPGGYELLNLGPSGVFAYVAQQCRLCPPGYYCPGGISSAVQCPSEHYAPTGAASIAACQSAVFVVVDTTMPLLKTQFTAEKQQIYVQALAQTAQVSADDVEITDVSQLRRAGAPSIDIQSQVVTNYSLTERYLFPKQR